MIARLAGILRLLLFHFVRLVRGGTQAAQFLGVTVGQECRIYSTSFGSEPWLIEIGDRVTVTAGVAFITHDGSGWLVRDREGRRFRYARVVVGDDVFIGLNSLLMPGVKVGNRVVIAAGSVVTKSVPTGSVVAGNPARIIMSFDELEARIKTQWVTAEQMKGRTYQERINSVLEPGFKPEMKV